MDPNTNREEQMELARQLCEGRVGPAARLAELVLALDEWLSRGGFPPRAWTAALRRDGEDA